MASVNLDRDNLLIPSTTTITIKCKQTTDSQTGRGQATAAVSFHCWGIFQRPLFGQEKGVSLHVHWSSFRQLIQIKLRNLIAAAVAQATEIINCDQLVATARRSLTMGIMCAKQPALDPSPRPRHTTKQQFKCVLIRCSAMALYLQLWSSTFIVKHYACTYRLYSMGTVTVRPYLPPNPAVGLPWSCYLQTTRNGRPHRSHCLIVIFMLSVAQHCEWWWRRPITMRYTSFKLSE